MENSNLVGPRLDTIHPRYQSKRSPSVLEAVIVKITGKGIPHQAKHF